MRKLLFLLLAADFVSIVLAASLIGPGGTFLWLVADVVIGVWLVGRQLRAALDALSGAGTGLLSPAGLTGGLCRAIAGFLFLFPGHASDLAGLCLLLLSFFLPAPDTDGTAGAADGVIDVEWEEIPPAGKGAHREDNGR